MTPSWRQTFLAWAETDEHKRALQRSDQLVVQALAKFRKPYVAYSGGKDSTAMLSLVLRKVPDVMVLHWYYGPYYAPQPLLDEILANARKIGARNIRVETTPAYRVLKRKAQAVFPREFFGRLEPQLHAEGFDLAFVGLRAEESPKRKNRVLAGQTLGRITECHPIGHWTWLDVWAYIVANSLPYLTVYDKLAEIIGYERSRFTTTFDPEFEHIGATTLDCIVHWRWRHMP